MKPNSNPLTACLLDDLEDEGISPETAQELCELAEKMAEQYQSDPRHYYLQIWAGAEEGWAAHHGLLDPYAPWRIPVEHGIPAGVDWDLTSALLHRTQVMAVTRRKICLDLPPAEYAQVQPVRCQ